MRTKPDPTEVLKELLNNYKTASLATADSSGQPKASYTPVAIDEDRNFYIFVSELSDHTQNLKERPFVSLLLIEDENKSNQLFARNRLTIEGPATPIGRDDSDWSRASDIYRERFGKFFDHLAALPDFHLFCIKPETARLVLNFGQAFQIGLPNWNSMTLVTGK